MELNELAKHGRAYANWKKAFNHLKMKYSKIKMKFFRKSMPKGSW